MPQPMPDSNQRATLEAALQHAEREAALCYDGNCSEAEPTAPAWLYLLGYAEWQAEAELIRTEINLWDHR